MEWNLAHYCFKSLQKKCIIFYKILKLSYTLNCRFQSVLGLAFSIVKIAQLQFFKKFGDKILLLVIILMTINFVSIDKEQTRGREF